ncbi:TetR/AcrR family transcriptional regulator [Nocardioides sp.]|uniref:TetR/AcrR family transcriptional regulator n=1 Tax=Nocardioides sp. TaxID=35761 RepID=UPI003D128A40
MGRPKEYDEALRARLVDCATQALATGGVAALSLRVVAAEAATTTNAVYALFGGKAGLVRAAMEQALANLKEEQARHVVESGDPRLDLSELARSYRRWAVRFPALYSIIFEGRVFDDEQPLAYTSAYPAFDRLVEAVRRAADAGQLSESDAQRVALSLWTSIHGWITLEPVLLGECSEEERVAAFDAHLAGVGRAWFVEASRGA